MARDRRSWERYLQERIRKEVRADGVTSTQYAYEPAGGRLKKATDPRLQVTAYDYNLDNTLQQTSLTNAGIGRVASRATDVVDDAIAVRPPCVPQA